MRFERRIAIAHVARHSKRGGCECDAHGERHLAGPVAAQIEIHAADRARHGRALRACVPELVNRDAADARIDEQIAHRLRIRAAEREIGFRCAGRYVQARSPRARSDRARRARRAEIEIEVERNAGREPEIEPRLSVRVRDPSGARTFAWRAVQANAQRVRHGIVAAREALLVRIEACARARRAAAPRRRRR